MNGNENELLTFHLNQLCVCLHYELCFCASINLKMAFKKKALHRSAEKQRKKAVDFEKWIQAVGVSLV